MQEELMKKGARRMYEVLALYSPEISEEEADEEVRKIKELVEKAGGEVLESARWRKRKLAFPVKHFNEGFYGVVDFVADKQILSDLDYSLRYNEKCLRYIIINLDRHKAMAQHKKPLKAKEAGQK